MQLHDYIERMNGATTAEEARDLLVETVVEMGIHYVAYSHISKFNLTGDGDFLKVILTFPADWVSHYFDRKYQEIDPINRFSHLTRAPFYWNDVVKNPALSSRQTRMVDESHEAGLVQGISVPLFGPQGEQAILSLATPESNVELAGMIPYLSVIASQFHVAHQCIVENKPEIKMIVLTEREREVLLWSARGKSNWVISEILNISESGVNFHITNAMRKLDASSRIVAILKAIRHGLICP